MRRTTLIVLVIGVAVIAAALIKSPSSRAQGEAAKGRTYYVRQTVGADANDGLSAKTAWRSISKLSKAMQAGDTAYVGPGLYRDRIEVENSGTAERRLTFIADTTGQHTGDPAGVVMITGAEPVDGAIFLPHSAPGVYMTRFNPPVWGMVEMDGAQYRYNRVTQTKEHLVDKMAGVDVVAKFPSSWFYDEAARVLYIHTTDGKPPSAHEMEIIRRVNGFFIMAKFYVTIIGFTFRHMGDSGINFFEGSGYGIAVNNTSYGGRQGIRVFRAQNVSVYGNTLFRNENCGVYFLKESLNGVVVGNTLYENIKGVRFGSRAESGLVIGNTAFDNYERGISIEDADDVVALGNKLVNNKMSQVMVHESQYRSEGNCFENGDPEQFTADFYPYPPTARYKTLASYQQAKGQDLRSREGGCGPLPEKVDVRKIHEETKAYTERARKILIKSQESSGEGAGPPGVPAK